MRTLRRQLPGKLFPVSASATASGASPLTVSTTGVASGDFCFMAATTTNSILDVTGPQGGGWTQLWMFDLATDEEVGCWYKVAGGAEPGTWTWAHSSGTAANALMVALRAPSFVQAHSARNVVNSLGQPGTGHGGQTLINVVHECNGGNPAFSPAPDYSSTAANQFTGAWVRAHNPWPSIEANTTLDATAGVNASLSYQGLILVG